MAQARFKPITAKELIEQNDVWTGKFMDAAVGYMKSRRMGCVSKKIGKKNCYHCQMVEALEWLRPDDADDIARINSMKIIKHSNSA